MEEVVDIVFSWCKWSRLFIGVELFDQLFVYVWALVFIICFVVFFIVDVIGIINVVVFVIIIKIKFILVVGQFQDGLSYSCGVNLYILIFCIFVCFGFDQDYIVCGV